MEDVGGSPLAAAAAPPGEAEREIPAANTEAGQLQHEREGCGHHRTPLSFTHSCVSLVCASADVGAPLVSPRLEPRRDSAGKPACELCGRRLSDCKGKLHKHGPGKICTPCYKIREGYRSAPVAVASPLPARSHKRKGNLSPAAASPPPLAELPPPVQPLLHLQLTFSTHAWSLQPGHRNSRALAASWMMLATSSELKSWEKKRGGFYQHETHRSLICSQLDELRVRLRASNEALDRSVLHHTGSQFLCSSCCDTRRRMRSLHISMPPSSEAESSPYYPGFGFRFGTQKQNMPSNAAEEPNREPTHSGIGAGQLSVTLRFHHFCVPSKSSNSTTKYDLSLQPT